MIFAHHCINYSGILDKIDMKILPNSIFSFTDIAYLYSLDSKYRLQPSEHYKPPELLVFTRSIGVFNRNLIKSFRISRKDSVDSADWPVEIDVKDDYGSRGQARHQKSAKQKNSLRFSQVTTTFFVVFKKEGHVCSFLQ